MYPRIPWELVADPLGSAEHTLGTTALARRRPDATKEILSRIRNQLIQVAG
jgi:hypothetical protein